MVWATFWAIFSQKHLVTLFASIRSFGFVIVVVPELPVITMQNTVLPAFPIL
jgi:hypothetical protein